MTPCRYSSMKCTYLNMNTTLSWSPCANISLSAAFKCHIGSLGHALKLTYVILQFASGHFWLFSLLLIAWGICYHLASFFFGIRGAQVPKDAPASPTNRHKLEYKTVTSGSPVSDIFTNAIKRFDQKCSFCVLNVKMYKILFFFCSYFLCILLYIWRLWATLIRQMISSCYQSVQWQRTKNTEAWSSRQHGHRWKTADVCTHSHTLTHMHSLTLCQWQLCLAWGYSICEGSSSITVLSLEAIARATCKAKSKAQRTHGNRGMTQQSTYCHCMCTTFCRCYVCDQKSNCFVFFF